MHVDLTRDGVALTDQDNFRELDVRAASDLGETEVARELERLGVGRNEPGHAWFPVQTLLDLGRPDDPAWRAGFDAMLAYADTAGWVRADGSGERLVRAHLVRHSG